MNEPLCLIDTDVFSYILKRREPFYQKSRDYLRQHSCFKISCLTYYESLRGYKALGATKRLEMLYTLFEKTEILYLEQGLLDKAADMYGILKTKGDLPGEIDLLLGATALWHDLGIVTNNIKHYQLIQRHFPLKIEDWKLTQAHHEEEEESTS